MLSPCSPPNTELPQKRIHILPRIAAILKFNKPKHLIGLIHFAVAYLRKVLAGIGLVDMAGQILQPESSLAASITSGWIRIEEETLRRKVHIAARPSRPGALGECL